MPPRFPDPGPLVIRIRAIPGVTRYRTRFATVVVPLVDVVDPLDIHRFKPLGKLSIVGDKRNVALDSPPNAFGDGVICQPWEYTIEDTVRSCSFWIMNIQPTFEITTPLATEFQVRQAVENVSEVRWTGVYTPKTFGTTADPAGGLMVSINGIAAHEWELWGRVVPGAGAAPFHLAVRVCANAECEEITDTTGEDVTTI